MPKFRYRYNNTDPRFSDNRQKQGLRKRIQPIDEPANGNQLQVLRQLKESVETLAGERGDIRNISVSWEDMEGIGLVTIYGDTGHVQNNYITEPEEWHEVGATGEPAFVNSWANVGGGAAVAAFYKDQFGIVHLKGEVDTGTSGTTMFTLPVGYRPLENMYFIAMGAVGSYIYITTAGLVQGTRAGVNVGFNNVYFRI